MKNKNLTNGEIGKKGVEEIATNKVTLGDLIWVKHDGGSWWPAQVFEILFIFPSNVLHQQYMLISPTYI